MENGLFADLTERREKELLLQLQLSEFTCRPSPALTFDSAAVLVAGIDEILIGVASLPICN